MLTPGAGQVWHCLNCGGKIARGQEAIRVPAGRKGIGNTYRHASDGDCQRQLGHWSGGGYGCRIDEPDYTEHDGAAYQGLLSRHLREDRGTWR